MTLLGVSSCVRNLHPKGYHGFFRKFTIVRKTNLRERPSMGRGTVVQHNLPGDGADFLQTLALPWISRAPAGNGIFGWDMSCLSWYEGVIANVA